MASGGARVTTGCFIGTGSAFTVATVGFRPQRVRIVNLDGLCAVEWNEGMADASAFKQNGGTQTHLTSNGITPTDTGFTLGADTDMNVDGEQVSWVAWE